MPGIGKVKTGLGDRTIAGTMQLTAPLTRRQSHKFSVPGNRRSCRARPRSAGPAAVACAATTKSYQSASRSATNPHRETGVWTATRWSAANFAVNNMLPAYRFEVRSVTQRWISFWVVAQRRGSPRSPTNWVNNSSSSSRNWSSFWMRS